MDASRLARLLEVRRQACREAKQALAEALAAERKASTEVENATAVLAREAATAIGSGAGDGTVEAYVRWLPTGRSKLAEANLRRDRAMEGVALARATLSLAMSSERAIETALSGTVALEKTKQVRREVRTLDEIAARRAAEG